MSPVTSLSIAAATKARSRFAGLSLREALPDARFLGAGDVRVTACCSDPAACREGDLFVALLDEHRDGHDFASEAIRRGASAVLTERRLPIGAPQCLVEDTREAYGEVCQHLAGQPSQRLRLIGVTGASGKTTTSRLLASVLAEAGQKTAVFDSLGRHEGAADARPASDVPSPPAIAEWLASSLASGCRYAVLELPSTALAARTAAGLSFDAAVLTNLRRGPAHIHGNLANYRRATRQLFDALKPRGFAIVGGDDSGSRGFADELSCPTLLAGMHDGADINAEVIERFASEQTFLLHAGDETTPVRTFPIGDHHVANCLSAAATALALGIDAATIARGLEKVERLPGRMERVECGQEFRVFVDSAHTPDRLAACLKTLRKLTSGRLWCVFGARNGGARDERPLLGRAVEQHADYGIITSAGISANANEEAAGETPLGIAHDILDGYYRPAKAHLLPNRASAIGWAMQKAAPGDAVLIAGNDLGAASLHVGAGTKCSPRDVSDDVAVARHWLYREAKRTATPRIYAFAGRG